MKELSQHTGQIIRIRILKGKNAGCEVLVLDIPHVVRHLGGDRVEILMPGMEATGIKLTVNPEHN